MGQGGSRPWADLFPFVVLLVVDPLHKPSSFSLLSGQLEVLDCGVLGTVGLHSVCIEITPWRAGRRDLLPGSRADGDVLTLNSLVLCLFSGGASSPFLFSLRGCGASTTWRAGSSGRVFLGRRAPLQSDVLAVQMLTTDASGQGWTG